jgi:hypothetical protein
MISKQHYGMNQWIKCTLLTKENQKLKILRHNPFEPYSAAQATPEVLQSRKTSFHFQQFKDEVLGK